jgi:MFS transporter, FHS family, glucose/mannose:H+ symporter
VLSLFWVGMVAARLVLARLTQSWPAAAVLPGFQALALAGAGLLLAVPGSMAAGVGLFLLGAGLAAGYPILLGFLGGLYRDLTGTAFSAVFVMALVGGSTLSYLTGVLGDRLGLRASLVIVPAAIVAQAGLLVVLRRRLKPAVAVDVMLGD